MPGGSPASRVDPSVPGSIVLLGDGGGGVRLGRSRGGGAGRAVADWDRYGPRTWSAAVAVWGGTALVEDTRSRRSWLFTEEPCVRSTQASCVDFTQLIEHHLLTCTCTIVAE